MNKLILLLTSACLIISCTSKPSSSGTTIDGTIKNMVANTKVYLEQLTYDNAKGIDTTMLDNNGHFSMKTTLKEQGLYQIRVGDNHAILVVLGDKPTDLTVSGDTSDMSNFSYQLKGSSASQQLK